MFAASVAATPLFVKIPAVAEVHPAVPSVPATADVVFHENPVAFVPVSVTADPGAAAVTVKALPEL